MFPCSSITFSRRIGFARGILDKYRVSNTLYQDIRSSEGACVDRRRLDTGVARVPLHQAEVPAGPFQQLHAARTAKRVGVDRVHADALAEILYDLPDALTGHSPGLLLAAVPPVPHQEQRLT